MTTVMALSLWQPWASAIFVPNVKPIETRHWSTHYRGLVAIHAAKKTSGELVRFYNDKRNNPVHGTHFYNVGLNSYDQLPLGALIGIADIVDVIPTSEMTARFEEDADAVRLKMNEPKFSSFCAPGTWPVVEQWGDFSPGRFGWCFKNIRRFRAPMELKGRQGLWPLSEDDATVVLSRPTEVVAP